MMACFLAFLKCPQAPRARPRRTTASKAGPIAARSLGLGGSARDAWICSASAMVRTLIGGCPVSM
jgi:hypothetical protein